MVIGAPIFVDKSQESEASIQQVGYAMEAAYTRAAELIGRKD